MLGSTVSYDEFVANSKKMVRDVVEGFKNLPANITAFLKIVTLEFIGMFDKVLIYARFFAEAVKAVFTDDTIDAAQKRRDNALQASNNNVRTGIELALQQRDIQIENAALARQVAEEERRGQRAFAEFQKKNIQDGRRQTGGEVRRPKLRPNSRCEKPRSKPTKSSPTTRASAACHN